LKPNNSSPSYIGITGHRNLPQDALEFVQEQIEMIIKQIKVEHTEGVVAVSALAIGADQLFAEVALEQGIPLEVVIPFKGYEQDFGAGEEREHFESLRRQANVEHLMVFAARSDEAYLAAGRWVVEHTDLLVAVWDGKPAAGRGGTGDIVEYARQLGKPCWCINPRTREVKENNP